MRGRGKGCDERTFCNKREKAREKSEAKNDVCKTGLVKWYFTTLCGDKYYLGHTPKKQHIEL